MSNNNENVLQCQNPNFFTKHTLILPHTCQFEKQRKSPAGDADAIEQESTSSVVLGNPLSAVRARRARPESPQPRVMIQRESEYLKFNVVVLSMIQ